MNYQLRKYNLTIEFRHVKGHTSNQDQRSKAQRFCDERARSAMRLERSKIRLQECKELISEAKKKENRPKKGSGHLRRNTRMKEKADMLTKREREQHYTEADYQTWMRL